MRLRHRLRWRLQIALVFVALVAIVLSGYVQIERARRDERLQRLALMKALPHRAVRRLFGPAGIHLLQHATSIEILRVGPDVSPRFPLAARDEPLTRVQSSLTAEQLKDFVRRASPLLLDGAHYFHRDVRSTPERGLRFREGDLSLDLLFARSGTTHLDLWTIVRDQNGKVVFRGIPASSELLPLRRSVDAVISGSLADDSSLPEP